MSLDHPLFIPAAISLLVIILVLLLWLRMRSQNLECRDPLFSPEYRAFLGQLDMAVRSHLSVFPRMPVNEVLQGSGSLKKFKNQCFDFVICHRREMDVLCVVLLDLPNRKGQANDPLRELCNKAGISVLEYDKKPYRDVPSLKKEIFSACGINDFEPPVQEQQSQISESDDPSCPKCHSEMKLTHVKKGQHAGRDCWVCINYPQCKGAKLV
ncbi:DUF2726 domain-containing protein [Endozoicomonas numazuensis]|uniref:DUF2726 domain-containing protein n=1 Tax=Endozoicomonas numazuensis TaxID=1137799 RepID=A0A081NLY7_9GAMM|nr:DUF2726 domain-containing protein [Endozoicomonas numazuensis]KEQ19460.1 hypothetical protein GZ78_05855 [Endozoicomonas numazuensis]